MKDSDFAELIKPDRYQVFLFTCPPSLPLSFARHPWFVVNQKGKISRWGIRARLDTYGVATAWGHLCLDALPPTKGLRVFYSSDKYWWGARLHGFVEGGEGSLAQKMAETIELSSKNYPYCHRYAYVGPNSNTYVQWVINQFPESGFTLPWNSFGKNFN